MYTQPRRVLLASITMVLVAVMICVLIAGTASQTTTGVRPETRISTTYALSSCLRADDLEVSVHEGKAILSGKVGNGAESVVAIEPAQDSRGIKSVGSDKLSF